MKISYGNSRTETHWKNSDISWDDLKARVSTTQRTTETIEEYRKMTKAQQSDVKDIGGFVGGHLKNGRRKKGNVLCRSMLALDMDFGRPGIWDDVIAKLPYRCLAYSTHKHTPENPRLRLIIPLTREITEAEYPAVSRMVAKDIGIDLFDDSTYEAHRLMFWPSTLMNGQFFYKEKSGPDLNPDDYLSRYDDWHDESTWPVSSRQSAVEHHGSKEMADPLTKAGIVGAFCRAYPMTEAIDKFLPDVYAPSAVEGRYDYIPGEGTAGVVIYDDKFAYSHHATDPVCGKLLNAFDLVRLHKFSALDEKCAEETPATKLPSYKAMADLALKNEKVKVLLTKERQAQAKEEFSSANWQGKLTYDKSGQLQNTLHNLTLILQNDENLKAIVFNQQLDGMEIRGEVPCKHPSKYWRDADDAQLVSYIDSNYGTFSQRNYQIAVTKVADDRSYHPIREYLKRLPTWDGIPRVDTLLIDYLGADNNDYVKAVTRKTLCAAVCRVLNPGCKFDSMLVLNGPQGIGKSTLIARLAGEWFSDSLSLNDTKDKTAAEKLQGYWILEIGELAGLRKAEVETLRSFLSRQNDIYRASFGRRPTPHLRQCVFFGTTNAESGYNNNVGALQFLAGKYFHNPSAKGILKNLGFSIVSNVQYDEMFELYLKHERASLYDLASEYIAGNGTSLKDSLNGVIDLPHLAITTLSYFNKPLNPPSWNGWAGDLVSVYSLVQTYHDSHSTEFLPEIARAYIGGEHPEKDLKHAPDNNDNTCNFTDLCSDGYAILLAKEMAKHDSLADSFKTIFEAKAGKEFDAIRSDIGTENEIPNIQARVSEIVGGLVTNLLSTLENNFKDSDKDVKDACINTFACWLHSKL